MKFQTLNMHNFCFSLPINFRLSPNPHYQKFFGLIFFLKNVLKNAFKVVLSTLTNDFSQNNLTRHMKLLLLKFLQVIYWHANFQKQPLKVFYEKGVLKNFANFTEKATQLFSFEFCKIFKNTFLTEHLWATASELRSLHLLTV